MLGWKVKDTITGFEGIVTGYVTYLTGCNQALVSPKLAEDGAYKGPHWFDEQRLDRIGSSLTILDNTGGPGADLAPPKR